jgi:ElaB/YqjD/DUF883 family membrane-anchored ribosome-binding protein
MSGAKDSIKDMTKDLPKSASDVHKTIDRAAEAAQPVVDRLASTAHASVDRLSGMLGGASQSMGQRGQQLTEAYENLAASGREYVKNKPGTAVLAALGAGYLLAKMLGRRR